MQPYIRITRSPYEEPHHLQLQVQASNGQQVAEIEIYCDAEDLAMCGDRLAHIPREAGDRFQWELGSERSHERWAFYFRLSAEPTNTTGNYVIHFRFNNNRDLPHIAIAEFCLPAEPAALNHLGQLLRRFAAQEHEVLYWHVTGGELLSKAAATPPAA